MEILCIGDLNGDLIVPYGKALKQTKGEDPVVVSFRVGGSVSNTAQYLGYLGDRPHFVGDLCGDPIGRACRDELRKLGVDLSYSVEGSNVAMLCVAVTEENGDRLILPWFPPGSTVPHLTEKSFSRIPREDYWLFTGGMMMNNEEETMASVAAFFREMKETTNSHLFFDMNLRIESYGLDAVRRHYYEEMISLCDVIIGNYAGEFSFFTDTPDMETGCMELGKDRIVICHNGTDPIFVANHGRAFTIPVDPVKAEHTIGAGDVFNAGILHGFASGMNCEEAVREGALQARNYLIREKI